MTTILTTCYWRSFPDNPPKKLPSGQCETFLVAVESGNVFECSWLNNGWHKRHDGYSDITKSVRYWCAKPESPVT